MVHTTRATLLLLLLLLFHSAAALGLPPRMVRRSVSAADLAGFRGAILVKNGQTTSCEIALIDNKAAIVAAGCLDYSDGSVSSATTYEVYFDGAKSGTPGKVTVAASDIVVHPRFSLDTMANNIAVLQFSYTAQGSWVNYIAAYRDEWTDTVYVRRTLASPGSMQWLAPAVQSGAQDEAGCTDASMVYERNQRAFFCSRGATPSPFQTTCSLPYGSVYGVASSSMAIAALYSHTVSYGGNACGGGTEYHFYTVLTNYLKFVRSVLGRAPKEFVEDTDGLSGVRRIIGYFMGSSTAPNADGTTMFGGNLIGPQPGTPQPQPQPQPPPQPDADKDDPEPSPTADPDNHSSPAGNRPTNSSRPAGSTPTQAQPESPTKPASSRRIVDPADANNSYDNTAANGDLLNTNIASKPRVSIDFESGDNSGGMDSASARLSQTAIIAIAVSVPLGIILIAAAVFAFVRSYRRSRLTGGRWHRSGGPKRKSVAHSLIEQLGGAAREERLPTYEDLHAADMRDLNLSSPRTLSPL
ncbi:hypothetical protein IWQ56_001879 [Coemansia nantahalensis]|nr:hypothetical protein IWQ56_001879 [Coemansia nantahalensis]